MKNLLIDKLIDLAIEEDINTGDITTESLIPDSLNAVAEMTAKAEGVISGLALIRRVFEKFEKDIKWTPFVKDGEKVKRGDVILRIEAKYSTLLKGERISLNILQRMSGIATKTADYVNELKGYKTELLDTRKTVPGMRIFDKQAVSDGGAKNHRMGLYDLVMIKDNHIKIAGSITKAVEQIRKNVGQGIKIEVETTNLDEVKEALECNVDIIMLDNMSNDLMKEAVMVVAGRTKTEASGNMTIERLKSVAETGVDYISVGALTHSVTALDISMNIKCA
ncbi:putative nicotinate-nucleotide pyrophosphorylase [carboxylating] [bioreactor metagenome]|uniref:Probable nicotinate-nucleotide pyrophosphorylase [carboxylating] n=1 Tax=bioreactor metagenome TaxID=1076179 RepID=A0A645CJ56_9ZZZZ